MENKTTAKPFSFKPYYNWNAFNTKKKGLIYDKSYPCFKPYYNWNAFNTP